MILMNTLLYFTVPDPATTEFVSISAFGEQNVTHLELKRVNVGFSCSNQLYIRQIKIASLDIRYTQVRYFTCRLL